MNCTSHLNRRPFPDFSIHYSPIYFERTTNNTDSENQKSITEYFLQVDSVPKQHGGLPSLNCYITKPANETTSRLLYYSPFIRQVEPYGCMEDAIKILLHCFRESNLTEFLKKNAQFNSATYHNEPTPPTYELTTLPARFLVNIERFDTMRHFQENEPSKFQEEYKPGETVEQHISSKGNKRTSKKPEHKNDISGQNFLDRRARYKLKAFHPELKKEQVTKKILDDAAEAQAKFLSEYQGLKINQLHPSEYESILSYLFSYTFKLNNFCHKKIGTPLHLLILVNTRYFNTIEYLKNFIKRGVNINAKNSKGETALALIFIKPKNVNLSQEIIKKFIAMGANPHIKDKSGKSALDHARKQQCSQEIITSLEAYQETKPEQPAALAEQPAPANQEPAPPADEHTAAATLTTTPAALTQPDTQQQAEYSEERDTKKLIRGVGFILAGTVVLAASALLLATSFGAAIPALLISISLITSMTGAVGTFAFASLKTKVAMTGTTTASAGTAIPAVSNAIGLTASHVAQVTSLFGSTTATTAVGSTAFLGTMMGMGAGFVAGFVLLMQGIKEIRNSKISVSRNHATMFGGDTQQSFQSTPSKTPTDAIRAAP